MASFFALSYRSLFSNKCHGRHKLSLAVSVTALCWSVIFILKKVFFQFHAFPQTIQSCVFLRGKSVELHLHEGPEAGSLKNKVLALQRQVIKARVHK